MKTSRRDFIVGATAAVSLPFMTLPAHAASATRRYRAFLGSSKAGSQVLSVTRNGNAVTVGNQTNLVAKLLGIPVYRYELTSTEVWSGGALQSISSVGKDNGKKHFVQAKRSSGGLQIEGSRFSGVVAGKATSSTFFVSDMLGRRTWVSTQTGKPITVNAAKRGKTTIQLPSGKVACTHYHFSGGLKYPVDAYFAENGDLLGYMFEVKGQRARIIADSAEPAFKPIWG